MKSSENKENPLNNENSSTKNLINNKKENSMKSSQNNNQNSDIEMLKKEIEILKAEKGKDKSKMEELKSFFISEINKLQRQIKSLSDELSLMKQKKKKIRDNSGDNNINNDKDNYKMDLQESDDNMEEDDHRFKLECLSRKLNTEIFQGVDKADINIVVRNNSKEKFPKNSCLICDSKQSLLLCENCDLSDLEPNQQKKINIQFKNLKNISKGEYKSIVKLSVENKIYHSSLIELSIKVISAPNIINNQLQNNIQQNLGNFQNPILNNNIISNPILMFRNQFNLFDIETYNDQIIENALRENNNDFSKAFESLFNN